MLVFSAGLGEPVIGHCYFGRSKSIFSIMTKPQFQFHLSLYFLLSIHTLSGSFFLVSDSVCLCKWVWVCMLRGHIKGRITRTQTDCEVVLSPQKARGRRLSALHGLPHRPTASCRLNRVSQTLCFRSLRWHEETFPCRGTGESWFWKQQCAEWQTPVLRWQRTKRVTHHQASCHWLFTVFWWVYLHNKSHFLAMLTLPAAASHT